ncbi:unnamed protein product [Dicrocoelium dendriticum]|nr:unnamed protein product [Dicrocoelium dendriticum]
MYAVHVLISPSSLVFRTGMKPLDFAKFDELCFINIPFGLPLGQSQLCRQMNFKLISRLASDTQRSESSKCGNNEDYANSGTILGNVSQQNQAQEPNLHSTDAHLRHEMWRSYRFLLLPGSLALLTLIGMQIVICSFWIPRSCTHQLKNPFNKNPKNASEDLLEGMETAPLRCRFCYIKRPIASSHGPVETNSFTRFMEHKQQASVPPRMHHKLANCALSKQEDDVEKDIHKCIYYQCSPSKRVKLKVPMRMCYPPRHRTHTSNIASVISNNFVTPHLELHSIGKCTSPYIYSEREKQKSVFITGQANDNISI